MTTPPSTDITEAGISEDEFGTRFLAYVGERMDYHNGELAKLTELRRLWTARTAHEEVPDADGAEKPKAPARP